MEVLEKKVNVFILTGFLGAGKTTLLNQLLKQFEGERNVVIENEFGKVNIDAQLIVNKFETVYELTNGCICCSLDEELYDVLTEIGQKKDEIDNLFIETTGIADVGNIATIFKVIQVAKVFDLKKIICVVDCESIEDIMTDTIEPQRQLIASDCILLNKTHLVNEDYLDKLEATIQSINPFAKVIKNGDLNKDILFEDNSDEKMILSPEINKENAHKINNVLYESNDLFDYGALLHVFNTTLLLYYHQIFRIKGFVKCINYQSGDGTEKIYEVQSTGKSPMITVVEKDNFEKNQLVFIGKHLKTDSITRILRGAVIKRGDKVEVGSILENAN